MAQIQHIQYYSNILQRDISVEITGHWGHPVVMFPSSGGQYYQNRDFGLNGSVNHLIEDGKIKLYNVETLDMLSFYHENMDSESKLKNYDLYVRFLAEEFIPYVQRESNTHRVAVAGVSFGAYHAANFAFRFPDLVSHLISMSGVFSIRSRTPLSDDMKIYYNSPNEFMRNAESWKYNHMKIVLSTSNWDICKDYNVEMAGILKERNIDYWYDEKQWVDHDWPLWKMAFPEYLGTFFG